MFPREKVICGNNNSHFNRAFCGLSTLNRMVYVVPGLRAICSQRPGSALTSPTSLTHGELFSQPPGLLSCDSAVQASGVSAPRLPPRWLCERAAPSPGPPLQLRRGTGDRGLAGRSCSPLLFKVRSAREPGWGWLCFLWDVYPARPGDPAPCPSSPHGATSSPLLPGWPLLRPHPAT